MENNIILQNQIESLTERIKLLQNSERYLIIGIKELEIVIFKEMYYSNACSGQYEETINAFSKLNKKIITMLNS